MNNLVYKFQSKYELNHTIELEDDDSDFDRHRWIEPGFYVLPKTQIKEWLDENTPTWKMCFQQPYLIFYFKSKEDAMLFKLTWA
jgi:hypothetical protein